MVVIRFKYLATWICTSFTSTVPAYGYFKHSNFDFPQRV